MRITGQGAVYVRALQQLSQDEDSDEEISGDCATLPSSSVETDGSVRQRSMIELHVQKNREGGYLYFGYF